MAGSRKLGRPTDHRNAMLRGMVTNAVKRYPYRYKLCAGIKPKVASSRIGKSALFRYGP